jgi:hypothetical protein
LTGRRDECPRTRGEGCTRTTLGKSTHAPAPEITWFNLVARCIEADVNRTGLWIDRQEIRAIIDMSDREGRLCPKR